MATEYPIRAVAKLTGIGIDTLRAWERRYGAVIPERAGRGRSYSEAHIDRLRRIKSLIEGGHAIGRIAALSDAALVDLLAKGEADRTPVQAAVEPRLDTLLKLISAFDHRRLNEELGRMAAVLSPSDVVYRLVLPLMREVGERWHRGEVSIAQEHFVTAALKGILAALVRLQPVRPNAAKMVMATLPGDLHEFGILAAAMIAANSGLDPVVLGVNLPGSELARAARTAAAKFVLVGNAYSDRQVSEEMTELAKGLCPGTALWVGGPNAPPMTEGLLPEGVSYRTFSRLEEFEAQCQIESRWSL